MLKKIAVAVALVALVAGQAEAGLFHFSKKKRLPAPQRFWERMKYRPSYLGAPKHAASVQGQSWGRWAERRLLRPADARLHHDVAGSD